MQTPLMNQVLNYCTEQYNKSFVKCNNSDGCQSCLDQYHYSSLGSPTYSCLRSCFYYISRYIARFNLEVALALRALNFKKKRISVLSLGCGPATELCALDDMILNGSISEFDYVGVDYNQNWVEIQEFQKSRTDRRSSVKFVHADACEFIKNNSIKQYDIVIFNYFLSDFERSAGELAVSSLLNHISQQLGKNTEVNTVPSFILNDIRKYSIAKAFQNAFADNFLAQRQERVYYTVDFDKKTDFLQEHGFRKKVGFRLDDRVHQGNIVANCEPCTVAGSLQMLFKGNTL